MNPNQVKVKGELACFCCEGTGIAFNAIDCEWACCLYCGGSGRKREQPITEDCAKIAETLPKDVP